MLKDVFRIELLYNNRYSKHKRDVLEQLEPGEQNAYSGFARVYDKLMAEVDYDAWADYLFRLMGNKRQSVADCACGTGQISIRLAKLGCDVTGIDISEDMLRVAGENARQKGVRLPFIRQDIKRLSLHKPVDVIVCACDGVNYLTTKDSVEKFFKSAYKALKPGGKLLFDISSRHKLEVILGNNTFAENLDDCAYIWENAYDAASRLSEMDLTIFKQQGRLFERSSERHVQRAHSQTELENWLIKTGFGDIRVYEPFTMNAANNTSARLQFAAAKPAT